MERLKDFNQQKPVTSMEQSLHFQQKRILRDTSFSNYSKPYNHHQASEDSDIFDAQKYFNDTNNVNDPKLIRPGVGGSKVMFNNNLEQISESCDLSSIPRFSSASSIDGYGRNYRAHSFHATPTVSSEASWNSQTGLLSNPPGAISVSLQNPVVINRSRRTTNKWRRCPCSGKKSVQVEENLSEPKIPNPDYLKTTNLKPVGPDQRHNNQLITPSNNNNNPLRRFSADQVRFPISQRAPPVVTAVAPGGAFTFPILNDQSSSPHMKVELSGLPPVITLPEEFQQRSSLEIFRPSNNNIQQNCALMTRQSFTFPESPKSRLTTEDDVASDASSDLFEIESFSTSQTTTTRSYQISCNNNYRRDSLDEALSFNSNGSRLYNIRTSLDAAQTECYEPSEASIDWSVTTAEAFDKGSVTNFSVSASEFEELPYFPASKTRHSIDVTTGGKKKGGGMLSGCRCEKAVSVGPQPVKYVQKEGPNNNNNNNSMKHVRSRPHSINVAKPPLARSHSARLALPYAT